MSEPATYGLFRGAKASAIHLEQRDSYTPHDPVWMDWQQGLPIDPVGRYRRWFDLISETATRGVRIRRARVVSEPVTDYIRFEHALTKDLNLGAGEEVRWLARHRAWDLLIPGCDFWIFDGEIIILNHFDGNGDWVGEERRNDPVAAIRISEAFERIWDRAVDHEAYRLA